MSLPKRDILPDRQNFFRQNLMDPARIFALHQVHSQEVVLVQGSLRADDYCRIRADGLVASAGNHWLTVTVADCLPIFLVDTVSGAFGIVHSGWKGTGIVLEAVNLMVEELGCSRKNIAVTIGPGIGPCCYEIPRERYQHFKDSYHSPAVLKRKNRYYADLRQANIGLLTDACIEDIRVIGNCTACSREFHSFRRDGADAFGLMLACIGYPG